MADKAITELVAAEQITATDLFVLQQNNTAKKLPGQVLLNWLTRAADGHGGIQSWVPLKKEGLVTTYRVTLADQTFIDIDVVDGRSIESVKPTSTNGLVVTYTVTYNDGTTSTFTVTNGAKGDKGDNANVWIRYASQKPTASSHSFGEVADAWIGICSNHLDTAPTDWQEYTWYQWKGEKGDTGDPATIVRAEITYQVGDSGTIIPSGSWGTSVPPVTPGRYLWTRQVLQFNTGAPITSYSTSRFGIDGTGSVSTVAGVSPDADGNVPLTASDVKALPVAGGTMEGAINMNGQSLSGLNAPTKNNQAANMGFVNQQVKKAAPRNLLDNSDFRNPVMQAGFCGYHGTVLYPIDRWYDRYGFGMFTRTDKGITVACGTNHGYLNQQVNNHEKLSGKKLTLAFCDYDGNIYIASGLWNTVDSPLVAKVNADCEFSFTKEGFVQFVVTAGSVGLQWGALYEGEYTIDTLPEYQPKGYGAELAECYRYYYKACNDTTLFYPTVCVGENAVYCVYSLPTQMRVKPTVSAKTMRVVSLPGYSAQEGFTFEVATDGGNQLCIGAIKTAHGLEQCMFEFNQIEFSADL